MNGKTENIKRLFESALSYYQNAELKKAENLFNEIIKLDPLHFGSIFLLGTLSAQVNRYEEAEKLLNKAKKINPNFPEVYNNLGNVYQELTNYDKAVLYYQKALEINPNYIEAQYNLGKAFQSLDKKKEAINCYNIVIKNNPKYIKAHNNLGNIFQEMGKYDEALSCYKQLINIKADYPEAYFNLGNLFRDLGNSNEAILNYQKAISNNPNFTEALNNLGNMHQDLNNNIEAIDCYQKAIQTNTKDAKAYNNLGKVYNKQNEHEKAKDCYEKAIKIDPNNLTSHWLSMNNFPIIYQSTKEIELYSKMFEESINKINHLLDKSSDYTYKQIINALTSSSNFYLPYQGKDVKTAQKKYALLVERLTSLIYPLLQKKINKVSLSTKIKIGFVSTFFKNHSVSKTHKNWILKLNDNLYKTYVYYLGKKFDPITHQIKERVEYFVNETDVKKLVRKISENNLDIIIYLDIGMNPKIQILSSLRLAPIQCNTWGHPVTSGFKSIDYFLSSEFMEKKDSQRNYTEQLINLPALGIDYQDLKKQEITRINIPNKSNKIVFLNLQSLYKLLPQDDHIFLDMLKKQKNICFYFIQGENSFITAAFKKRILNLLKNENISFDDHFYFHPRCSLNEFLGLIENSDVILDSINWSGCNTSLDALSLNKPIVTFPSDLMRGRHTYSFLKKLDINEIIATSKDNFIEIALKLANDNKFRDSIIYKIIQNKDKLFNDEKPIRFLENFFNKKTKSFSSKV